MPYVDIYPHRRRPKWWAFVGLTILAVAPFAVVVLGLAPR